MSQASRARRKTGKSVEHQMWRYLAANGEAPVGKHAMGDIHRRYGQALPIIRRKHLALSTAAAIEHDRVAGAIRASQPVKAPLFHRVKDAFARLLRGKRAA